jgi:PAS domain S-box-containing protein
MVHMKKDQKPSSPPIAASSTNKKNHKSAPPVSGSEPKERASSVPEGTCIESLVLDRISDGVLAFDTAMTPIYVNERAAELLGRKPADLLGHNLWDAYPDSVNTPFGEACQSALATQTVTAFDGHFPAQDSWLEGRVYPSQDGLSVLFTEAAPPQQAESDRWLREERYPILFSTMQEGFILAEVIPDETGRPLDYRILEANVSMTRFLGKSREELVGHTAKEVFTFDEPDLEILNRAGQVALGEQPAFIEDYAELFGRSFRIHIFSPGHGQFACLFADTTEPKRTESALQKSEDKFSKAFHLSPSAMAIMRASDGKFLDINDSLLKIFGFTREQVVGKGARELGITISDEARQGIQQTLREKGVIRDHEVITRGPSGSTHHVLLSVESIEISNEPCALVSAVDITERKRAEEKILDISKFPSQNPNPIMRFTRQGELLYANPAAAPLLAFWNQEHGQLLPSGLGELLASRNAEDSSVEIDIEGAGKVFSVLLVPIQDADYVNLYFRDVTERRQTQESLRALIDQTTAGITRIDLDGTLKFVNETACEMLGYSEPELLGRTIWELTHPEDIERGKRTLEQLTNEGGSFQIEKRFIRQNGSVIWVSIGTSPLRDSAGNIHGSVGVMVDITRRKIAEETLLDSARRTLYLASLSDTIRPLADPAAIQAEATRVLGTYLKASRVTYMEIKPDRTASIQNGYTDGLPDWTGQLPLTDCLPGGMLPKVEEGRYVASDDVQNDPRYDEEQKGAHQAACVHAQVFLPFIRHGELIGALCVQQSQPRAWKNDEIALIEETAERMQAAIERARTEEKLRSSEERMRAVISQSTAGLAQVDQTGTFTFANERYCEITGYSAEELLSRRMQDITHPEDLPQNVELFRRMMEEGIPFDIEKRYIRKDGSIVWVHNSVNAIRDSEGHPASALAVVVDITMRKQMEQELVAAKTALDAELDGMKRLYDFSTRLTAAPDLESILDRVLDDAMELQNADFGNFQLYNRETGGLDIVVQRGFSPGFILHFKNVKDSASASGRALKRRERVLIEDVENDPEYAPHLLAARDAGYRAIQSTPLFDSSGEPFGALVTHFREPHRPSERELRLTDLYCRQVVNVIERKQAEDVVRQSEEMFSTIFRSSPIPIAFNKLPDGTIEDVNGAFCDLFGYSREELLGHTSLDFGLVDREARQQVIEELHEKGRIRNLEQKARDRNGKQLNILTSIETVHIKSGPYSLSLITDITERKEAEQVLRESQELFSSVFHASPTPIVLTRIADGKIVDVNEVFCQLFGYSREEILGRTSPELGLIDAEARRALYEHLAEKGSLRNFEQKARDRSGRQLDVLISAQMMRVKGEQYSLTTIIDITGRKGMEQLLRSEQELLSRIFDSIPVMLTVYDPAVTMLKVNKHLENLIGWSREELQGMSIMEACYPDPEYRAKVQQFMDSSKDNEWMDIQMMTRSGRRLETSWSNIRLSNDMQVGIGIDISERKRYEQSLVEYLRRQTAFYTLTDQLHRANTLKDVFNASMDAMLNALQSDRASILLYDESQTMRFTAWRGLSDEYRKATDGHSPWQPDEKNAVPITIGDIATAKLDDSLRTVIQAEGIGALAFIPLISNGRLIGKFMLYFNQPHRFNDDDINTSLTIAYQLALAIDRKRSEQALRESEQRLSLTYQHARVGIAESSLEGSFIEVNEELCRMLGYERQELLGLGISKVTHPEDLPGELELYSQLVNDAIPFYRIEKRFIRKDGSLVWGEVIRSIARHEDGKVKYAVGAVIDISERKQREEQLRARTEEIETLMEVSPISIFVAHDPDCTHITGNPAGYQLVEMPASPSSNVSKSAPAPQQPTYRTFRDGVELEPQQLPMQVAARTAMDVEAETLELRFEDGSRKFIYAYARPLFNEQGHTRGAIAAMMDITESKQTEDQIQRLNAELQSKVDEMNLLLEVLPVGVWVGNEDCSVITGNTAAYQLLDLERGINASFTTSELEMPAGVQLLIDGEAIDYNDAPMQRVARTGEPVFNFEHELLFPDGKRKSIFTSVVPVLDEAGQVRKVIGAYTDITERKQMEDALQVARHKAEQTAYRIAQLQKLTAALSEALTLSQVAETVVAQGVPALGTVSISMLLLSEDGETLEIIKTASPENVSRPYVRFPVTWKVPAADAARFGQIVWIESRQQYLERYPHLADQIETWGHEAALAIPMVYEERILGVLTLSFDHTLPNTREDREYVLTLAQQGAQALERARATEALRESEARFRAIVSQATAGIVRKDASGKLLFVNQAFCGMLGYEQSELVDRTIWEFMQEEAVPETRRLYDRMLTDGTSFQLEKPLIHRDGSTLWAAVSVSPVLDAKGRPHSGVSVYADITERKRAEQQLQQLNLELEERVQRRTSELQSAYEYLRESEATSRLILESMPDAIVITNQKGLIVHCNTQLETLFGYSAKEVLGKPVEMLIPQRFHDAHRGHRASFGTARSRRIMGLGMDLFGQRKDGSEFPVDVMLSPMAENTSWEVMVSIRDNTEQRQAQEALRVSEEKLRTLFEILPVGISFLSKDARIVDLNTALANILGISKQQLLRGSFQSRRYIRPNGTPMPPTEFASTRALTDNKTIYNVETGIVKENGQIVWTSVNAAPVHVADVDAVVVTVDITERKQAEAALHQNRERLKALSRRLVEVQEDERRALARELHDRVGQNLAALNLNLNILRSQFSAEFLKHLGPRLDDSVNLVNQILMITRNVMDDLRSNVLDDYGLEAALSEYTEKFTQRFGIPVVTDKPANALPRLSAGIEMTLLRIAQEALINVSRHAQATQVNLSLNMDKDAVSMTIKDNGSGILSWQKANQPGSHGLRIIRERAEAFGGTLQVNSAYKKGTEDHCQNPAWQRQLRERLSGESIMIKVILADDHPVVRDGLRFLLDSQKDIQVIGTAVNGMRPSNSPQAQPGCGSHGYFHAAC